MRPSRLTTRRLMVIVAVVGLILGAWLTVKHLISRSRDFREKSDSFRRLAKLASEQQNDGLRDAEALERAELEWGASQDYLYNRQQDKELAWAFRERAAKVHVLGEVCARLAQKYHRASLYPWLIMPPDPPLPYRDEIVLPID